MAWTLATATQNAMANALGSLADGGSIEIRTGGKPASANDVATGTLLATFTLTTPAFAAAAGGVINVDADPDITAPAAATGTAGWGRIKTSTGGTVVDGTVGTSGADFIINATAITTGDTVTLLSGSLTVPGA